MTTVPGYPPITRDHLHAASMVLNDRQVGSTIDATGLAQDDVEACVGAILPEPVRAAVEQIGQIPEENADDGIAVLVETHGLCVTTGILIGIGAARRAQEDHDLRTAPTA